MNEKKDNKGNEKSDYVSLSHDEMEKIEDHIRKYLGDFKMVIHEKESEVVHIDVIPLILDDRFPFNMLVSMGMSAKPMNVPDYADASEYAELVMLLPKDWKLDEKYWTDKKYFWPISVIKHLARFPHMNDTFLAFGHTINNGGNSGRSEPYADNTELNNMFIDEPRMLPEGFNHLKISDEKTIDFLCLVPIYEEELEFKRLLSANALIILLEDNGISQVVDITRKNCNEENSIGLNNSFSIRDDHPRGDKEKLKNFEESIQLLRQNKCDEALHHFKQSSDAVDFRHPAYRNEIQKFLSLATEMIVADRKKGNEKLGEDFSIKIRDHWFTLVSNEYDYGDDDKAAHYVDQALKINNDLDFEDTALASEIYGQTEQFEKILLVCNLYLKHDPNEEFFIEDKVDALLGLGRYKEALKNLEKIIKLSSFDNLRWDDLRISLLNLNGKYSEAIQALDKRLKKYNNKSDISYDRAYALYKIGKIEEVVSVLKRSTQTSTGDDDRIANLLYFLGYIIATEFNNLAESLKYLKKAHKLNPSISIIKKTIDIIEKAISSKETGETIKTELPQYTYVFQFW